MCFLANEVRLQKQMIDQTFFLHGGCNYFGDHFWKAYITFSSSLVQLFCRLSLWFSLDMGVSWASFIQSNLQHATNRQHKASGFAKQYICLHFQLHISILKDTFMQSKIYLSFFYIFILNYLINRISGILFLLFYKK